MQSFLWILFVISPWCTVSVRADNFIGLLQELVNLDLSKSRNISAECKDKLLQIRNGLREREIWALKLLDASSHLSSDFVWGNNIAPGVPRSCSLVSNPKRVYVGANYVPQSIPNLTQIASPFPVIYRVLHARHHSRLQLDLQMLEKNVLDFGFCMPVACNHVDSEELFRSLLSSQEFLNRTLLDRKPEFLKTKLLEVSEDFFESPFVQGFLVILCITLSFIVLDIGYKTWKNIVFKQSPESRNPKHLENSFLEKLLSCFSINENVGKILLAERSDSSIPAMDGLKAISMFFFIVGHLGLFGISAITNFPQALVFTEDISFQPLFSMHLCIDTFYLISATIVSYSFFEYTTQKRIRNKFAMFIKMVINRYLRLTPSYMVQIFMVVTVEKLVKDLSPYFLMDDNEPRCEKSWWKNILYINNFEDPKEMCMIWSYFLATEFQLFVISSALLLIVITWSRLGIGLFGLTLIGCMAVSGYFGYTLPLALTFHTFYATSKYLYTPFWCRVPAYFVGLFGGWYLSYKGRKMELNRKFVDFGWTVAGTVLLALVFGQINVEITPIAGFFYAAFARFAWATATCWVIVACTTGHGGLLGKFLSSKFFVPFSRITYCAYLINPPWILLTTMLNDTPLHLDFAMLPPLLIGYVITVYAVAFIFTLLFESPLIRLTKLIQT